MKKLITLCAFPFFALSADAQLSTGLIAHWTFTGHTNDITTGAHHATPHNITYGIGKAGSTKTAAFFNGMAIICIYNTMGQLLITQQVNIVNNQLNHAVSASNLH